MPVPPEAPSVAGHVASRITCMAMVAAVRTGHAPEVPELVDPPLPLDVPPVLVAAPPLPLDVPPVFMAEPPLALDVPPAPVTEPPAPVVEPPMPAPEPPLPLVEPPEPPLPLREPPMLSLEPPLPPVSGVELPQPCKRTEADNSRIPASGKHFDEVMASSKDTCEVDK